MTALLQTVAALAALVPATSSIPMGPPQGDEAAEVSRGALRPLARDLGRYLEARSEGSSAKKQRHNLLRTANELAAEIGEESLLRRDDLLGRAWSLNHVASARRVRKGKVHEMEATPPGFGPDYGTAPLRCAVRIPKKYGPRGHDHPLVIVVASAAALPTEAVELAVDISAPEDRPGEDVRASAVIVAPALPVDPAGWTKVAHAGKPGGVRIVHAAIDEALARYAVDREQVHLIGIGPGAALALAAADHAPHRFASVNCLPGDGDELAPGILAAICARSRRSSTRGPTSRVPCSRTPRTAATR